MTTWILLVTHPQIGKAMASVIGQVFSPLPLPLLAFDAPMDGNHDQCNAEIEKALSDIHPIGHILMLTDIEGATPSNVASRLCAHYPIDLISGLNLPMLFKLMNYPNAKPSELVDMALAGAQSGIKHHKGIYCHARKRTDDCE